MAVNDDGARFPWLAMARYMVATVVTVLAVVVIVMMITVDVLRPEKISVSVLHGHVQVTALWQAHVVPDREVDVLGRPVQAGVKANGLYPREVQYEAANYVSFGLTLGADNPSGRANIHCTNVTIRFLDMPSGWGNFTGMTELGNISLGNLSFLVKEKSSHRLRRWDIIYDKNVLSHLATTYAGWTSFTGAVHVSMSISSDTPVGPRMRYVEHYCSSLTVSVDEPSDTAGDVPCLPEWDSGPSYSSGMNA